MQMKKSILTICLILFSIKIMAQGTVADNIEMADTMRSSGKIYVVVLVILVILSGLIIYLINLDRKVSKLEKEITSKLKK